MVMIHKTRNYENFSVVIRAYIALVLMLIAGGLMTAQTSDTTPSEEQRKAEREYAEMLGRIQQGDMTVDFRAFRVSGAIKSGSHGSVLETSERAAFRNVASSGDWVGALDLAKKALERNYASPIAHFDAMSAYLALRKTEEAAAHEKILNALLESIRQSGDGKSPETAYFVVTVQEEYIFLNRVLRVRATSQNWVKKDGHFYDRLSVPDATTNQVQYLWFNADFDSSSDPQVSGLATDGILATVTPIRPGADPALPPAGARSMDAPDPTLVSTLESLKKTLLSTGPVEWSFTYPNDQRGAHRRRRKVASVVASASTCQVRIHFDYSPGLTFNSQVASLFLESIDTIEIKTLQEEGDLLGTRLGKPNFVTLSTPAVYNLVVNGRSTMILFLSEKQATDAADAIRRSALICQSAPIKIADPAGASNLADSLGLIKEKLADSGAVDYRSANQYPTGSRTDTYSTRISNVTADVSTCQIHFDLTRRINGGLAYSPELMDTIGAGKETISLRRVERADVRPVQNSIPEVYTLFLTLSDGTSTGLEFEDRQIADQLAKAMLHAAEPCNGGREDSDHSASIAARQGTGSDFVSPRVDPSHAEGSSASPLSGPRTSYAVLTKRVQPEYTPEARAAGLQGSVILYLEVSPTGEAQKVQVIQSLGLGLDEKAIEAVKQWRFKPGMIEGKPTKVTQSSEVQFRLDPAACWRIRRAGYRVNREGMHGVTQISKPELSQYIAPDKQACHSDGGVVIANLQIGKDGKPDHVKLIEAQNEAVSDGVLDAIRLWRFQPGVVNGKRREGSGTVEMECVVTQSVANTSSESAGVRVYQIGQGISLPAVVYKVEPEYSEEARRAKFQGTVIISVLIDVSGHAGSMRVVRPLGLELDEKAMEAINLWRFKPATKDGKPVIVTSVIEVNFRLL
jgi:TonB family protein